MPLTRSPLKATTDALIAHVREVARQEVNATVDAARDDARTTHTWRSDHRLRRFEKGVKDTNLELQIKSEHADPADPNPTAIFGYTRRKGFYGLFHEEGTVHEHEYPALRPAADRQFPQLRDRIEARLR